MPGRCQVEVRPTMRIDSRFAPAQVAAGPRPAAGPARPGFRLAATESQSGAPARAAAPLATLDAILMLQGDDSSAERRRRSARRGQDLLDALDGLKAALLGGAVPLQELGRLTSGLAAASVASGDPTLDGIVAAIELRAQVELAKLGGG